MAPGVVGVGLGPEAARLLRTRSAHDFGVARGVGAAALGASSEAEVSVWVPLTDGWFSITEPSGFDFSGFGCVVADEGGLAIGTTGTTGTTGRFVWVEAALD